MPDMELIKWEGFQVGSTVTIPHSVLSNQIYRIERMYIPEGCQARAKLTMWNYSKHEFEPPANHNTYPFYQAYLKDLRIADPPIGRITKEVASLLRVETI